MEKSTLIKLRQRESTDVKQNGAYNVSLKESVILKQGDIVKLHTAILDTSTESFVTLEEDTDISMSCANYFRNYKYDAPRTQQFQVAIPASQPDLNVFFPCFEDTLSGDEYTLKSIIVWARRAGKTQGITLDFHYQDAITGLRHDDTVYVRPFAGISHASKGFEVPLNRIIRGRTVTLDTTSATLKAHDIADGSGNNPHPIFDVSTDPLPNPSGNEVHNTVFTRDLDFTISAGRYYPSEIATIINDQMSNLESLGTVGYNIAENKYPVMSPFMGTIHQIEHLATNNSARNMNYNPSIPTPGEVPTNLMTFDLSGLTQTEDVLIGANEVSLNYDQNLKKLNFDALHMPFYIEGGTPPAQGGVPGSVYPDPAAFLQPNPAVGQPGYNTPIPMVPQTNYGGVFFTKLEPTDFWTRQLGFDELVVNPEIATSTITGRTDPAGGALPDIYPTKVFLTPGKNIVTSFNGLDNIVQKNSDQNIPKLGNVSTALTTPIISKREFDTPASDEGYYLIEVGMNLPQKMIGGAIDDVTTSNKVAGIMGKYFTSGNFLQSQGQGGIIYQHIGDPVLLSDMAVTIRNPDGTIPTGNDLGDDNSIFLEIVKEVQVQQPTPPSN